MERGCCGKAQVDIEVNVRPLIGFWVPQEGVRYSQTINSNNGAILTTSSGVSIISSQKVTYKKNKEDKTELKCLWKADTDKLLSVSSPSKLRKKESSRFGGRGCHRKVRRDTIDEPKEEKTFSVPKNEISKFFQVPSGPVKNEKEMSREKMEPELLIEFRPNGLLSKINLWTILFCFWLFVLIYRYMATIQ